VDGCVGRLAYFFGISIVSISIKLNNNRKNALFRETMKELRRVLHSPFFLFFPSPILQKLTASAPPPQAF